MTLIFRKIRTLLIYALMLVMLMPAVSSCATSNERAIRKIERQSRRNPAPTDMAAVSASRSTSRTVRRTLRNEERRNRDAVRDAERASNAAVQRHFDMQTPETRERMERNMRETNRRHNEPFFSRLFRRKTEQEKIERLREREARRRLNARRQ
jgi:hypothetical protein